MSGIYAVGVYLFNGFQNKSKLSCGFPSGSNVVGKQEIWSACSRIFDSDLFLFLSLSLSIYSIKALTKGPLWVILTQTTLATPCESSHFPQDKKSFLDIFGGGHRSYAFRALSRPFLQTFAKKTVIFHRSVRLRFDGPTDPKFDAWTM